MEVTKPLKYYRHKIDNLLVVSQIVTVHHFEFDKHFVSEGEEHDFWEMVYVESGEFVCTLKTGEVTIGEGEAMFHRPGEYHRHASGGRRAPNVFIVSFECRSEGMRFFEGRRVRLPRECVRQIYGIVAEAAATFDIPVSDPLTKKMELLPEPALGGTQMIKNRLEMLLIQLLRKEMATAGAEERFLREEEAGGRVAAVIIEKMRTHLADGLSVEALCEGIAYSRSYIFKEFRRATGRSIADYYNAMRIEAAKRRIREEDRSFAEIADALHFDTPNYFCKTFKRYVGVTPRAYRARYRRMP